MDAVVNQRRHPRVYLKVAVREKIEDSEVLLGHSRDISREGIFIETRKSFPLDSILHLRFNLPYISQPIEIQSRVRWIKPFEDKPLSGVPEEKAGIPRWVRPGVGLYFEGVDARAGMLLNKFFEEEHKIDSDNYNLSDFIELPDRDIFAKTLPCFKFVEDHGQKGYRTYRRPLLSSCANRVVIFDERTGRKKEMIMMASNNYLGLTTHPKVVKAATETIKKYGVGSGGAPQLSGTFDLTRRLEEKLAQWKGCENAIVFPAGYSASVGIISALVKKDDAVIIDHLAHASLIDGCMMSRGHIEVFKHNDISELENILKKCDRNYAGKLVVIDSIYSMDGDIAPLPEIKEIADAYGARIMTDEAHASGVIGKNGRGITDHFNMEGKVDVVMGTLSKAIGALGGFAASSKEVISYLRYYSHSYFFSTSLPASVMASALAAIDVIESEPHIRERLWRNIRYMKERLTSLGFNTENSESAIIPIIIGDEIILRKMSKDIHKAGIYLNSVPYPAVPRDKCRFRLSLMATHTQADLDETLEVLEKVGREFGVISSHFVIARLDPRLRGDAIQKVTACLDSPNKSGNDKQTSSKTASDFALATTDEALSLKTLKSITEIGQKEWDSILGKDRIICSYNYLRAVEESGINDCDYRYLLVYEGEKLIAHACIYSMSFELDVLARGATKRIMMGIRKIFPNFLRLKFIECGTPVALGNTISFAEESDVIKKAALGVIMKGMEDFAKSEGIKLTLLRDFTDKETPFFDCLKELGYARLSNLPNAVIGCKWTSFSNYLEDLRSHYRFKIKKQIKRAEDNGVCVEVESDYRNIAPWLLKLWKNTYEKAKEYRREILTEDFFRNMNLYLREKVKIILLKKEDQILGYALVLRDDHTLRFMFTGINYDFNERYSVYFNCLYNVVKLAISEGKEKIDLGITTIFSKTDLGAYAEPLFIYMKHKDRFLSFFVTFLFKFMSPNKEYAPKRIFRENLDQLRHSEPRSGEESKDAVEILRRSPKANSSE